MNDEALARLEVAEEVDCVGELCPGPVLKSMEALGKVAAGQIVLLRTDLEPATANVKVAVETGGLAEVLGVRRVDGLYYMYMKRL